MRVQRSFRADRRHEDGASAVEFALVMPVLVLIVCGIIGFGIVFAQQLSLGNAARQAARFGAVDGPTCADIVQQAKNNAGTIAMPGTSVTVSITRGTDPSTAPSACGGTPPASSTTEPCKSGAPTDNVYVKTQYTSVMIVPFVRPSFNLNATGAFRCEFS